MSSFTYEGGKYLIGGNRFVRGDGTINPPQSPAYLAGNRATTITCDPAEVLIPDVISDSIGRMVSFCIEGTMVLGYDEPTPLRIADMGVGSGIFLTSVLNGLKLTTEEPLTAEAIDIDEKALGVSQKVLDAVAADTPRPVSVEYISKDYQAALTGLYDYIYFNPPYLERGHDITHSAAAMAPEIALYSETSVSEYSRVMPHLFTHLSENGLAIVRLPKEDTEVDKYLLDFIENVNDRVRLILISAGKERRYGRFAALFPNMLPLAFGDYDYYFNYLDGEPHSYKRRLNKRLSVIYHDDDCRMRLATDNPRTGVNTTKRLLSH